MDFVPVGPDSDKQARRLAAQMLPMVRTAVSA